MNTITAYKCKKCGHVMYPHHYRCLKCNTRDFLEITPSRKGMLLTFTVIDQLPWGIDERGRVVGVVEFDNGIRALGIIKAEKPKPGMKLEVEWEPVRVISGEKVYGLTFYPTK